MATHIRTVDGWRKVMDWEKEYWNLFDQYSLLWQYVAHNVMDHCGFHPPDQRSST